MLLQLTFYTNTFGISAVAIAILFLSGRLIAAIATPVMGVIADRTETQWGKFRPWILWTAVPFGIFAFLTFYTPNLEPTGKVIWAFVTYILLMLVYSANNIPYSALSGVITSNQKERNSLFSIRFILVVLACIAIQGFAIPMVNHFGKGDSAKGYMVTIGIFSILAVLFFVLTFLWTKERVKPNPEQKQSLKLDLRDLLNNSPWITLFVVFILMFMFLSIRNGMLLFYFNYCLDIPAMTEFMNKLNGNMFGLLEKIGMAGANTYASDSLFGLTNILGQLASILGITVSRVLINRFGKRDVFIGGLMLASLFAAAFYIVSPTGVAMVLLLQIVYNFAWGVTMSIPWAMIADVADFADWKFSRRSTAVVSAGILVGFQIGLAIGSALSSMLLSWFGYVAPPAKVAWVEQSAHAIEGIRLSTSIIPAILLIGMVIILFFYKITHKVEIQIQEDLAGRRIKE